MENIKSLGVFYNNIKVETLALLPNNLVAYDLTFSYSIGGEHATTVNGNGRNPDMKDILKVAENIGMKYENAKKNAEEIEKIVNKDLGKIIKKLQKG